MPRKGYRTMKERNQMLGLTTDSAMQTVLRHIAFWSFIVAVFVVPLAMIASDLNSGVCHYSCSRDIPLARR